MDRAGSGFLGALGVGDLFPLAWLRRQRRWPLWTAVQPWVEQLDQLGFQSSGLLSTVFFGGAFWEGWEYMFDAMQYGAVISLGLIVLALWRPWRRQRISIAIVLVGFALLLGLPSGANAAEILPWPNRWRGGGRSSINNDLIVFGRWGIDGTVKGDVIAFAQDLIVSGHVTGDLILFGQKLPEWMVKWTATCALFPSPSRSIAAQQGTSPSLPNASIWVLAPRSGAG